MPFLQILSEHGVQSRVRANLEGTYMLPISRDHVALIEIILVPAFSICSCAFPVVLRTNNYILAGGFFQNAF